MQVALTIADSAGTPTAVFWPVGDNDGPAMSVTVKGTDLFLHAEVPRGAVDIVLQRHGDQLTGTWSLGEERGSLTGTVQH